MMGGGGMTEDGVAEGQLKTCPGFVERTSVNRIRLFPHASELLFHLLPQRQAAPIVFMQSRSLKPEYWPA